MNKKKDILWRVYVAFILICIFGVAILAKSVKTQALEGAELKQIADSLTIFHKTIEAERGNIYTENGDLLATSIPIFEVRVDFASEAMTDEIFYDHVDSLAIYLSKHIGAKSRESYRAELLHNRRTGNRYYLLKRNATYPELLSIKNWPFFKLGRYRSGMIVIQKSKRKMPFGRLAQRTIGYVRDDGRFRVGLEGNFDNELSGEQGQILVQRIAGGTLIPLDTKGEIAARAGHDIYTTIDINLQDVAETALQKALSRHKADHGSVVLMEVATGKIKAIANLAWNEEGWYEEKYNYAVGESTEPGSTFKLAAMMALLEDRKVNINDSVDLEKGTIRYYDRIMRDAKPHDRRNVTVGNSFELSSNVGMSKLMVEHYKGKEERFYNHLVNFRLNERTGIEINGEPKPIINPPADWSGVSLPWISVGYEVSQTPLQTLTFYNAIANDGRMLKPYVVNQIKDYDQNVFDAKPVVLKDKICSDKTLKEVRKLLEGVVENGTANNLRTSKYKIAGKTGTARIADKNSGYRNRVYQSSFVGFFPADNPVYSCIVVINAPKAGIYYGSYVAGPVFREISDKVYANIREMHESINDPNAISNEKLPSVPKVNRRDLTLVLNELGISHHGENETHEWVRTQQKDKSVSLAGMDFQENRVPDVRGMSLKDAIYVLETAGLLVSVDGNGRVSRQSLRYGQEFNKGQTIEIILN
ncbi:MAG: transpeptidase family protein [Chitinophagales bacterium]|nr:transpeptidase family protein [Chitinophagales bacterium]